MKVVVKMAAPTPKLAAPSTTKNFHDSIRAMFTQATTGAGPANSTTSLAYHLENSGNAMVSLYKEQRQHNDIVVKLMQEQIKLLKKAASGGLSLGTVAGLGSALFGGGVVGKLTDRFIFAPIKNLFRGIGRAIYRYSGAEFAVGLVKGLKDKAIAGMRTLGGNMLSGLFSGAKALLRRPVDFVRNAGRPLARIGAMASEFIGSIFRPLSALTKLSTLGSIGSKALKLGKLVPFVGEVIAGIFSVFDAFSGWNNADKLLGKDKKNLTFVDKLSASYAELLNGITFGATDWLAKQFGKPNYAVMTRDAITNIENLGISIGTLATSLLSYAGKQVKGAFTQLMSYVPSTDQLILELKELPGTVTKAYEDLKQLLWDGMASIATTIGDTFTGFFSGIKDKIKGIFGGGVSSGTPAPQTPAEKAGSTIGGMFQPASLRSGGDTQSGNVSVNSPSWIAGPTGAVPLPFEAGVTQSPARISAGGGIAGGTDAPVSTGTQYNPVIGKPSSSAITNGRGRVISTANTDMPSEQRALLDTIAGTESGGYNELYTGKKFSGFADHPRVGMLITSGPNAGKTSSAAGRYQFLSSTWDNYVRKYNKLHPDDPVTDFSPKNQDKIAYFDAQQVYARKTGRNLDVDLKSNDPNVLAGISTALHSEWTSLPGGIEQGRGNTTSAFVKRFSANLERNQGYEIANPNPNPSVGNTATPNPVIGGTTISNNMSTKLGDNYQSIINGPKTLGQALGIQQQSQPTPTSAQMDASQSAQRSLVQSPVDPSKLQQTTTAVPLMDSAMPNVNSVPAQAVPVISTDQTGGISTNNNGVAPAANGVAPGTYSVGDIPTTDEWKMLLPNGSALT